eukprot:TRINITY_DN13354_c0_g1_i1.p1 TRINITY_DN13354_c0_g1~~TRINITY_DN13354_c0_g1_i1.p1  ORF type:complete len:631 (+),score=152.80 TRINITY_DN13354_c0_g1_i1:83-1975(+)
MAQCRTAAATTGEHNFRRSESMISRGGADTGDKKGSIRYGVRAGHRARRPVRQPVNSPTHDHPDIPGIDWPDNLADDQDICGQPSGETTGEENIVSVTVVTEGSDRDFSDCQGEWVREPTDLTKLPDAERLELELQVAELRWWERVHALFDAEGPAEEVFADQNSLVSRTLFFATFIMIIISVGVFTVESLPEFYQRDLRVFFIIESICIGWFTMELVIRFATCPSRKAFLRGPLNIVDFAAIAPYYLDLMFLVFGGGSGSGSNGLVILRVVRLTRVFRVFKLSKYDEGVQVVVMSLRRSTDALSLLIFLMALAMVLFGSGMFFAEQEAADWNATTKEWVRKPQYGGSAKKHHINSIPIGFWWCLVTLTTVGYGDMYPVTLGGYLVGSAAMMGGLLIVAFPIIIIGANFTEVRHEYKEHRRAKGSTMVQSEAETDGDCSTVYTHTKSVGRFGTVNVRRAQPSSPPGGRVPRTGTSTPATPAKEELTPPPGAQPLAQQAAPGGGATPPGARRTPGCGASAARAPTWDAAPARLPAAASQLEPPPAPPLPPSGADEAALREAGALARRLLENLAALEKRLSEVVSETVKEELTLMRAEGSCPPSPSAVGSHFALDLYPPSPPLSYPADTPPL